MTPHDFIHRKRVLGAASKYPVWQNLKLISYSDGYVMVRVRGGGPFTMTLRDWLNLPAVSDDTA
jgi:hypothetical protein